MTEKGIEARRAYKRKWAREHKESVHRSQEAYWDKQGELLEDQKTAQETTTE